MTNNYDSLYPGLEFDLLSRRQHGIISVNESCPTDEWKQEEIERKSTFLNVPEEITKIDSTLRKKMQHGVPFELRRKLWFVASGGYQLILETGDNWDAICESANRTPIPGKNTFGLNIDLKILLPQDLAAKFTEFLNVIWFHNRSLDFAPLIPCISAILLLVMEPKLAYYSIQSMIIKSKIDGYYFSGTKQDLIANIKVIQEQLNSKFRKIIDHIAKIGMNLTDVVLALFPTFFLSILSIPYVLTTFDNYIMDGQQYLIRATMAILSMEQDKLLQSLTPTDFLEVLHDGMKNLITVTQTKEFINKACKFIVPYPKPYDKRSLRFMANPLNLVVRPFAPSGRRFSDSHVEKELESIMMRPLPTYKPPFNIQVRGGTLLTQQIFTDIHSSLNYSVRSHTAELIFDSTKDGYSLSALYSKSCTNFPHILMIKTSYKTIGAYLSDGPSIRKGKGVYYGKPSTFVFDTDTKSVYRRIPPYNHLFISASEDCLMIGGPRPAIYLPLNFQVLMSDDCETFSSPSFCSISTGDQIISIELYALTVQIPKDPSSEHLSDD